MKTNVSENQFGFMPKRSAKEVTYVLGDWQRPLEKKRDRSPYGSIDLEKAHERVSTKII